MSNPFKFGWGFTDKYTPNHKGKEIPLLTLDHHVGPRTESVKNVELFHKILIRTEGIVNRQRNEGRLLIAETQKPPKNLPKANVVIVLSLVDNVNTTKVGRFAIPLSEKDELIQFENTTANTIFVEWGSKRYPVGLEPGSYVDELTSNI